MLYIPPGSLLQKESQNERGEDGDVMTVMLKGYMLRH
jgi:hypothetical protein